MHRAVDAAAIQKALGDDFGVLPFPKLNATGKPSVPVGAYGSCVSAKCKNVDAAKEFVKWLWVDQTDYQLDFAQSYGFHIPARKSLAAKADKLKAGPAADAVKFVNENGHAQTPILWSPKSIQRSPTHSTGSSAAAPTPPPRSRPSRP